MKNQSLKVQQPIETYDIDVAGHVNNIVFVRWLEELRTKLFSRNYSLEKMIKNNYHLVVLSTEVKYHKQIRLFDEPFAEIRCVGYKLGIMFFEFVVKVKNTPAVVAEQKCAVIELSSSRIVVEAELKNLFQINKKESNR